MVQELSKATPFPPLFVEKVPRPVLSGEAKGSASAPLRWLIVGGPGSGHGEVRPGLPCPAGGGGSVPDQASGVQWQVPHPSRTLTVSTRPTPQKCSLLMGVGEDSFPRS